MNRGGRRAILLGALGLAAAAGMVGTGSAGARRVGAEGVGPGSDAAQVALGRRLFHDGDLSINGTLSCATCHDPRHSFADGTRAHPGAHGEPGLRNVPSLVNVGAFSPLTWGNDALTTLERQAMVPIVGEDPVEMGMNVRRPNWRAVFPLIHAIASCSGRRFPRLAGGSISLPYRRRWPHSSARS